MNPSIFFVLCPWRAAQLLRMIALTVCATFTLVAAPALHAQDAPGQANRGRRSAEDRAAMRSKVETAKTLARENRLQEAEQTLTTLNRHKPSTAEWHQELAQRLIRTAEQLARDGQPANVGALARRAVHLLDRADTLAGDRRSRAVFKSFAGFIHERYLADDVAAAAAYDEAVRLAPEHATHAAEAVTRLRETAGHLRNKSAASAK